MRYREGIIRNMIRVLPAVLAALWLCAGICSTVFAAEEPVSYHYDLAGYCVRCEDVRMKLSELQRLGGPELQEAILNRASVQIRLESEDSEPAAVDAIEGLQLQLDGLEQDAAGGTVSPDGYCVRIILPEAGDTDCYFYLYAVDDTAEASVTQTVQTQPPEEPDPPVTAPEGGSDIRQTIAKVGVPVASVLLLLVVISIISDLGILLWYRRKKTAFLEKHRQEAKSAG